MYPPNRKNKLIIKKNGLMSRRQSIADYLLKHILFLHCFNLLVGKQKIFIIYYFVYFSSIVYVLYLISITLFYF